MEQITKQFNLGDERQGVDYQINDFIRQYAENNPGSNITISSVHNVPKWHPKYEKTLYDALVVFDMHFVDAIKQKGKVERNKDIILVNSLSLNMFPSDGHIRYNQLFFGAYEVAEMIDSCDHLTNAIGHKDLDCFVRNLLESVYEFSSPLPHGKRIDVSFNNGENDKITIVAQYTGPRLPEGAAKLPEGAKIRFYSVEYSIK